MLPVTWMPCKVAGMGNMGLPLLARATPCKITSYGKPDRAELQVWEEPGLESSFRNCNLPDIAVGTCEH